LTLLDISECFKITEQSRFYAGEKLRGKLLVAESLRRKSARKDSVDPFRVIAKTKSGSSRLDYARPDGHFNQQREEIGEDFHGHVNLDPEMFQGVFQNDW